MIYGVRGIKETMHISIIEDNQALLSMLKTALALKGYIVETYNDASSFLRALQKADSTSPCDLVIVDLFLARQSGTDIVDVLQIRQPQLIPAILISASDERTLSPIRKRYPTVPILQKPFKMQALISLIEEITSSVNIKPLDNRRQ